MLLDLTPLVLDLLSNHKLNNLNLSTVLPMRFLRLSFFFSVVVCVAAAAWFWTPDTDFDTTLTKYTANNTELITLDDGTRIHFRDTGNSAAQTLLLVHGTSDSLLTWDSLSKELEGQYRLVSLDLPGHGFSSAPAQPSFEHFVDVCEELLEHLGIDSAIWVGNSLGGGIAWRAALFKPERVAALVLLDPSGAPRTKPAKSNIGFKLLANPVARFLGQSITPRSLIERSLIGSVANPATVTEERVDRYWELLRLPGNRSALANLASLRRSDNNWARIGEIKQATLIVWGAEDQVTPAENAPLFQAAMQNAELTVYDGVGHLPMIEAPMKLAEDINRFVATLPLPDLPLPDLPSSESAQ